MISGMPHTTRRVAAPDGVRLAVVETGPAGGPVVVAIHGYPDNHRVWDGLAAALADRRVVTYDVRGTGESDKPRRVADYRMPRLLDDLGAVLDAVSPDAPVHLVGHDWGSIQGWAAVTAPQLAGRIASYTSISGPSLEYARDWLRRGRAHPRAALRQLGHSYYVALFQLPLLPELAVRRGVLERAVDRDVPRTEADKINAIALYRANMLRRTGRPQPVPAGLPVQLVVPRRDAFVTPELAVGSARPWVEDLTVHELDAGHWVVSRQPELLAGLIREFVARTPDDRAK
jgi:pimeloyl-ACP methyl ester carboxylesterase